MVGGWNPIAWNPYVRNEHWRSADDGKTWVQLADAPWEARHSAGWLDHNGKFFVIGGDNQLGHYQRDVWAYDDVNGWVQKAATTPWGKRVLHQVASHNGKIWVIAGQTWDDFPVSDPVGMTPKHYTDVWSSADEGATWSLETNALSFGPMSTVIGVPFVNGKFWMIGGGRYATEGWPDTFYDTAFSSPDLITWTYESTLPVGALRYNAVVAFKDHIVSIGGVDGANTNSQFVIASKDGVSWRNLSPAPWAARHAMSACVHKGEVYMLGGPLSDTSVWALS